MGMANALSVAGVEVDSNSQPLIIPSGTPSIVSVSTGSFIHGKIETIGEPTQVESSLSDFVYMTRTNGYTTTLEFDGEIQNNTAVVNLVEGGQTTYSLVLTPISIVKPTTVHDPSWNIPSIPLPTWVYGVILGLVALVAVVVAKTRQQGVKII